MSKARIIVGDCRTVLASMEAESVDCCVTSPPYWGLRDYGNPAQIGLEGSVDAWVAELVAVFEGVRRVLGPEGTLWLNLGDAYDDGRLIGQPWRVAFALQEAGWVLRADIIWHKKNPMPENVRTRPSRSHEYILLLSKSRRYFYDWSAIADKCSNDSGWAKQRERGDGHVHEKPSAVVIGNDDPHGGLNRAGNTEIRNARTVWTIASQPSGFDHFATFPRELAARCIKAGCPAGGLVLDPFAGTGTTVAEAVLLGRRGVGIELNPKYAKLAEQRIHDHAGLLAHSPEAA